MTIWGLHCWFTWNSGWCMSHPNLVCPTSCAIPYMYTGTASGPVRNTYHSSREETQHCSCHHTTTQMNTWRQYIHQLHSWPFIGCIWYTLHYSSIVTQILYYKFPLLLLVYNHSSGCYICTEEWDEVHMGYTDVCNLWCSMIPQPTLCIHVHTHIYHWFLQAVWDVAQRGVKWQQGYLL